jgi:hypothetical protein
MRRLPPKPTVAQRHAGGDFRDEAELTTIIQQGQPTGDQPG